MNANKPRYFQSLENWHIDGVTFKIYFISVKQQRVENRIITKIKDYLKRSMPEKIAQNSHNKAGYIIIHQGEMGMWLLTHWWAFDDIVLSTLSNSKSAEDDFINFDDQPFHACVWEHVVINHERDAWVKNVMTNKPSLENYVDEKLKNGNF